MLGIYNYTVILTYIGMLVSFLGLSFAMDGNIQAALVCLMVSGVCDMFDGKIASTMERTKSEKRFGIQIDSLSDLICFGALPAVIVYKLSEGTGFGLYTGAAYLLCALIRLAWFNVDEEERQEKCSGPRETYLGLPVTSAALLLPLFVGVSKLCKWPVGKLAPLLLIAMAAAFLTPFKLKKPALPGKIGMILCGGAELILLLAWVDI